MRKMKVVIACSTGGHLVEVRRLESVYKNYDYSYFTFDGGVARELAKTEKVVTIPNINRKKPHTWIIGIILSLIAVIKTRPKVIISTGAGVVVFYCIFARLFGAKLIFIESMARIELPTLTARMLYPFTNLFIVQWPNLLKFFPKAKYLGRLL